MKALIVHSRRTGLGIIRSLGKVGFDVFAADTFKAPGFYSRYTKKSFVLPKMIEVGEEIIVNRLIDISRECGDGEKLALYTGSDDYLITFCRNWNKLKDYFYNTFETDLEKLENVLEKVKVYNVAQKAKVPYPISHYSPINENDITFPAIIKPTVKKTDKVDVVAEAFRIKRCENLEELRVGIDLLKKINIPFVVQKYIPGGDDVLYTAGVFVHKGELIAAASGRKVRQFPPDLGECSLGELVNEPKLIEYSRALLKEANITGICQIEFKKWENEFYLIEINPRPWSWNSLMEYAGINLPYIAYQVVAQNKKIEFQPQKNYKGTWMYITRDFKFNKKLNSNITFSRYLKDVLFASKYALWSIWDPVPFFVDLYFFRKFG